MNPIGLSAYGAANAIGSTPPLLVNHPTQRGVSGAEMALKLGRFFNVSAELWMGVEADYDLEIARATSEAENFSQGSTIQTSGTGFRLTTALSKYPPFSRAGEAF